MHKEGNGKLVACCISRICCTGPRSKVIITEDLSVKRCPKCNEPLSYFKKKFQKFKTDLSRLDDTMITHHKVNIAIAYIQQGYGLDLAFRKARIRPKYRENFYNKHPKLKKVVEKYKEQKLLQRSIANSIYGYLGTK